MKPKTKYYAEGWGKNWWVMSRNRKSVAQCTNKAMATKIAKLLSEDAESKHVGGISTDWGHSDA